MPTTIYLSVRGDGSWRVLEALRRTLGEEAGALTVQPNRDESGFYGSAEVSDVVAIRQAFIAACQLSPGLKAYFGAPAPEHEDAPRRAPPRPSESNARGQRRAPLRGRGRGGDRRESSR